MSPTESDARLRRLRNWFLALAVVVVFAGAAVPITVNALLARQADTVQLGINCSNALYNRRTLQAINTLARDIGLPTTPVPPLPEECKTTEARALVSLEFGSAGWAVLIVGSVAVLLTVVGAVIATRRRSAE